MSRRRMIDPDILEDEKFRQFDFPGRLFFIGLILLSNDHGKLRGDPKLLKAKIFPCDTQEIPIEEYINRLVELGTIEFYEVNNEKFIRIKNWFKYQTLTYRGKDNIPFSPMEIEQKGSEQIQNKSLINTVQDLNKPLRAIEVEEDISRVEIEVEDKETTSSAKILKTTLQTNKEESVILTELQKIPNYPFDEQKDFQFIKSLKTDFPSVNILQEIKSWATWLIDKTLTEKSNPRTKLSNWLKKAVEFKKQRINGSQSILDEYYKQKERK